MIVSFDRLPEQLVPGFKGGDGVVSVRAYDDDMGRILQLTVPVGGSIGPPHPHRQLRGDVHRLRHGAVP